MIVSTSHYFHIIYYLEGKKKCRLGPMPSFPLSPTLLFKVSTRRRSNWSASTVALFFGPRTKYPQKLYDILNSYSFLRHELITG